MRASTALLALASLVASVNALGQAIIKNQCSSPVYIWSVSNSVNNIGAVQPGASYAETYRSNSNGGGISIKIATENNPSGPITQFEYTLTDELWYDVSNINGYPFMQSGLTVIPSDSSCPAVSCAAGVEQCGQVYNIPTDNHATSMCTTQSNLVLVLCSNQVGTDANPAASSIALAPTTIASSASVDFTPISLLQAAHTTAAAVVTTTAAPAPAPAVTTANKAAPADHILNWGDVNMLGSAATTAAPSSAAAEYVEYDYTTVFSTMWVTVQGRSAQPTAAPVAIHQAPRNEKRHHQHHQRA